MKKLIDHFLIVLYQMIFKEEPPCMSHDAIDVVAELVDWFSSPDGS